MYGMEDQKHGSKYKKIADSPNREKIARRLTDGKVKWGQVRGEKKIINRGDLAEEAKVWFYFLASVLVPTKHVCKVREQEAIILYAILKGYKLNAGAIIENSTMKYHEGNKRGLIPHPATITRLCISAGVKGSREEEEECPKVSPLTLTGVSKGSRNQKKKGVIVEADSKDEEENARQEKDTFMVEDQEEQDQQTHPEGNTSMFAEDIEPDEKKSYRFHHPTGRLSPNKEQGFQRTRRELKRSLGK